MRDIVVIGAGGFAREVAWLIEEINERSREWRFLGYIESRPELIGKRCGRSSVIGDDEFLLRHGDELSAVIGIGSPPAISRLRQKFEGLSHLSFPNLIHPSVIWDRDRVQLGVGNILCAGNILTTDIQMGSFNILNLASTYGHDVVMGDHCVVNPGVNVSGGVRVGSNCLLGTGSAVLERLTIGDGATIGAGAVVTKDVGPGLTVVGVPARPMIRGEVA